MRKFLRSALLVALAITTGLVASSNASAAMVKTVVETVSNVQNVFTIMAAAPAQPAAPTVVVGNKSATVSWAAPANNGAAITSYTVTSNPGEFSCTVSSLSCTVTGLTNGTAYTFTVRATNSLGTSTASPASSSVRPTHTPKVLSAKSLPTTPTSKMVFSEDGQFAYWATSATPPSIVKYDIANRTEVEKITLGSTQTAITSVVSRGSNAYFFFNKGYLQVDLDQFYVVATYTSTIEGWLYPSIDETGTYLYGIKNSASNNYGTHVHKYDAATGTLVASYTKAFNEYAFLGSVAVGPYLYVFQENGGFTWLQRVNISTMGNSGSAVRLTTVPALCTSCEARMEFNSASNHLLMKVGDTFVKYSLDNSAIDMSLNLAGTPDVVAANFVATTPKYYWVNSNSTSRSAGLRIATEGNGDVYQLSSFVGLAPSSTQITKPVYARAVGSSLFVFTVTGSSAGTIYEMALGDVANEPTNLTAQYGDEQATLTWRAPTDLGVGTGVSYEVTSTNSAFGCVTTELTCTITGLTNGTSYVFAVTATNDDGVGLTSSTTSVTPKRIPDAPTAASATYGNASATVSWSAPAYNGGAGITGYTVTSNPGAKSCTAISTARSCVVSGLTNGTAYTFNVKATNVVGSSVESAATLAVTPRTVPSAVTNVWLGSGLAKVSVNWNAPQSSGGSEILGYRVVATPGAHTCNTDAAAFSCELSSLLTPGTTYYFAVYALNAEGLSAAVTTSQYLYATFPSAPGQPTVTEAGDGKVVLKWTAPVDNGGAPIVKYTAFSTPESKFCVVASPALSCTITGLTNGVPYTFNVAAANKEGSSERSVSTASVSAIPRTKPDAPTSVNAQWGDSMAVVSWTPPASDGGFAISSYRVAATKDNTKFCIATAPATTCTVPGLVNGTAYTFRVSATNGASLVGPASIESNEVIPKTTPSAPLAPSITAGDGQLTLNWTPQGDGGSKILSYKVSEVDDPELYCTVIAPATSCTLTGLVNGAAYSFKALATNVLGDSPYSPVTTATPYSLPDAPIIYETKPSDAAVMVSWSAPVFDGGSPVLEYLVTASPSGKYCTTTGTECEVTDLDNGVAYTFTVKAKNLRGFGPASEAFISEPAWGTPSAPTAVVAKPGEWDALVSWQAPQNVNPASATYTVVSDPPGFGCVVTKVTSCLVSELANGTSYRFSVTATNEGNLKSSPASVWSNAVLPAEAPSEPQNVRVRSHSQGLLVSWSAPASDGGTPVTTYVVRDEDWQFECVTSATFCIVDGLELGATYAFTVRAENAVGQSIPSEPSAGVAYQIAQLGDLSVTASATNGEISVGWSKPLVFENTSDVSYLVVASPSSKFCEVVEPARTCQIVGLEQGGTYTVSVLATDQLGNSVYSSVNPSVLVYSKPAAPLAPTVSAGDKSVTVSWLAPKDGGSPILSYKVVEANNSNLNCVVAHSSLTCTIRGLTNGAAYSFKVLATNLAGDSAFSAASASVTPLGTPGAPVLNEVISGNGQIKVTWFAPEVDGGSSITGYTVTANPGAKTCITTTLECTVTGLTNGTKYTFTVKARNKVGQGLDSEPSRQVAPWSAPSAPTGIKGVAGEGSVEVTWIVPANTDPESTTYTVTSAPGGFECTVTGENSCSVEGLENGVAYTFTVVASNQAGLSKASASSAAVTPRTVPDAPQQVNARVVSTGVQASWVAPDFDGGSKVTFYTATAEPSGKTCVTTKSACVITGLTQGVDYYITVSASNVAGESVAKEATDLVTFGAVPGKPSSVFAIAGPGEMTVSWAAPANTGGSAIEYYVAESTPGGFLCVVEGQSCVVTGLTNGTKYTFTVRAANEFGEGDNSIASAAVAPVAKPGQPSVVESVFISYDQVLVSWTSASASVSAYNVSLLEPNYPYAEIDSVTVSGSTLSYVFEGLDSGAAYRVQVVAYGGGANYIRAASAPARKVGPVLFTEYPVVTGSATVGQTMTATDGVFVGLPAPSLTRAWYRCNVAQLEQSPLTKDCVAIKGATGENYKLTVSDLGKFIAFGVTATNAYGDTVAYGVVPGKVVSAPIMSKASTFSGTAKSAKVLTAKLGTYIGTAKITYKYQWMRCTATYKAAASKGAKCSAIAGATKTTYKLATADVGKYVRLVVTATNAYGKLEWHTATTGKVSK